MAEALGAHVELEVARWRRRQSSREELTEREALELLERIEAATETLERLARRLDGRRPPAPPTSPATAAPPPPWEQ